jgi:hypothetical protein
VSRKGTLPFLFKANMTSSSIPALSQTLGTYLTLFVTLDTSKYSNTCDDVTCSFSRVLSHTTQ